MVENFESNREGPKPPEEAPVETIAIHISNTALHLWRRREAEWVWIGVLDADTIPEFDLQQSKFKEGGWVYAEEMTLPSLSISVHKTAAAETEEEPEEPKLSEKAAAVEEACRRLAAAGQQEVTIEMIAERADLTTRSAGMVLAQSRDKFTGVTVEPIEPGEWRLISTAGNGSGSNGKKNKA